MNDITARDLELAIVSAIMADPAKLASVRAELLPADFVDPQARAVYESIIDCADAGLSIGLLTIVEALRGRVPAAHIAGMMDVGDLTMLDDYVRLGVERSVARRAREVDAALPMVIRDAPVGGLGDALEKVASEISSLAAEAQPSRDRSAGDLLDEITSGLEVHGSSNPRDDSLLVGLSTGFQSVNRVTGGFVNGELICLAARTSVGKTSLAINIATNMSALAGHPIAFYSIEMSSAALMLRILSSMADVDSQRIQQQRVNEFEMIRIREARQKIATMPLYLSDRPAWSVERIDGHLSRLPVAPRAIFVDYIQLMSTPGRNDNRVQQISAITRGLKMLAVKRNCPVIAVSQLRRTENPDSVPMLSDLRDSGTIEQDSDMVIFLHRPATAEARKSGETDLIVAKNRRGRLGTLGMRMNFPTTTFSEGRPEHVN